MMKMTPSEIQSHNFLRELRRERWFVCYPLFTLLVIGGVYLSFFKGG